MTGIFEIILMMSASASLLALLVLGARALFGRRQTVLLTGLFARSSRSLKKATMPS